MIMTLAQAAAAAETAPAAETLAADAAETIVQPTPEAVHRSFSTILSPLLDAASQCTGWLTDNWVALIYLAAGVVFSFLLGYLVSWLLRKIILTAFKCPKGSQGRNYIERLHLPILTFAVATGVVGNLALFGMRGEVRTFVMRIYYSLVSLITVWVVMRAITSMDQYYRDKIAASGVAGNSSLDGLMLGLIRRVVKVAVWVIAVVFICRNIFKFDVSAMLAGAGVAGLAIAFAAQNTVANLFGAISLVMDKPFSIGDFINLPNKSGTVESIGLRSTRIRALDGMEWIIPNKELSEVSIQNVTRRKYSRYVFKLGLVYATTADQLRLAESIMHEILDKNPMFDMQNQPPKIFFNDMQDWALQIEAYVWFPGLSNWAVFQGEIEKINFEIIERFNQAGLSFAFPSNTTYLVNEK